MTPNPPNTPSSPEPEHTAEAASAAAAVEQAVQQIETPADADRTAQTLVNAASDTTEREVKEQTNPAPAAAAAAQQAQQASTPEQAGSALLAASAAIAAASDEERAALEEAVQQAIGPADAGVPPTEQQRLLREAMLAKMPPIQRLDAHLFLAINRIPHPPLANALMTALTNVMNSGAGWLLILAIVGVFDRRYRQALRRVALPLWVATLIVEYPIKLYVRRRRPFITIVQAVTIGKKPGSYSFPSGHSASAFAGARLLTREFPELALCWYGLAALTGFSRIYLGVHYPGDVMSGALLGTLLAEGVRWLADD